MKCLEKVWLTDRCNRFPMKVQEIYHCIQEHHGHDHYEILVENAEWTARLTPGDNTVYYSKELHAKLEELLGKGMMEVQEVDAFVMTA